MKYVVAHKATGEILRHGSFSVGAEHHLDLQAGEGEVAICIDDLEDWTGDERDHVHVAGKIVRRTSRALSLEDRRAAVRRTHQARIAAGFLWRGHVFQVDDRSLSALRETIQDVNLGLPEIYGGYWRTAANVNVLMDGADLRDLYFELRPYAAALRAAYWKALDEIA